MSKAFILKKFGSAKNLQLIDIQLKKPIADEVLIEQKYINVSRFDAQCINGKVPIESLPFIPGISAIGKIVEIGSDVTHVAVGDMVAYCTAHSGAYAQHRIISQDLLIRTPDSLKMPLIAGALLPCMMAHTLLSRSTVVLPEFQTLVLGAAGAIGHILCQWMQYIGAKPIALVSNEVKYKFLKSIGIKNVLHYNNNATLGEQIKNIIDNEEELALNTAFMPYYDEKIFKDILSIIGIIGSVNLYGPAKISDTTDIKIPIDDFSINSAVLVYTVLYAYKFSLDDLLRTAQDIFSAIEKGHIKPKIAKIFPFEEIPQYLSLLERNNTFGILVAEV